MRFRKEVLPFIAAAVSLGLLSALPAQYVVGTAAAAVALAATALSCAYLLYFFRDPPRYSPRDPDLIVACADGVVASIKSVKETQHLQVQTTRISIFLSLMDVHVNRAPIVGKVRSATYHPGKRYFTFLDKSSEYNQHSAIVLDGPRISVLIHQIVGPVARRVVYWLEPGQELAPGDAIGMMKFGSRLDLYVPSDRAELWVLPGQRVRAGETILGRVR